MRKKGKKEIKPGQFFRRDLFSPPLTHVWMEPGKKINRDGQDEQDQGKAIKQ
jgi:hypothetical protein